MKKPLIILLLLFSFVFGQETEELTQRRYYAPEKISDKNGKVVLSFSDFRVESGDLSEYVYFIDSQFLLLDGTILRDFDLGDDWEMARLARAEYKNKHLLVSTISGFGRVGEEFGNYYSDLELFNGIPPYYCGKKVSIADIELIDNLQACFL